MRPKISWHILVFFERTFTLVFSATIDWFITQYTLSLSPSSVEGKSMLHDNSVILMTELWKLEVDPMLISWIAAFLTDRQQAARTAATLSDWKFLKGGLPQGVKLGVILFIIMTNNLFYWLASESQVSGWHVCHRNTTQELYQSAQFDCIWHSQIFYGSQHATKPY